MIHFFCTFCLAQDQVPEKGPTSVNYYEAEEYFIRFPSYWTLDTSGLLGTQFIATSPKEDDADRFRENVSLKIRDSKNLHNFIVDAEARIRDQGTLLESRRRINEWQQEYHVTLYTLREKPDLVYEQYYFFKYWYIYELTFVYEQKTFFEKNALGENVLSSFGFKYFWTY